jgi:sterol desaturase/sphingolipid hydroxylase (fatty acid hydroxylase superfamily)
MAWWNGPVLVACCQVPFIIAAIIWEKWALVVGASVSCTLYYAAYEYIHWCMHLPKRRIVERSGLYFRLNGHHLLHHRYMHKNFNVVLPLADLLLGTLILRSKVHFKQATGPAVPDVQPKSGPKNVPVLAMD